MKSALWRASDADDHPFDLRYLRSFLRGRPLTAVVIGLFGMSVGHLFAKLGATLKKELAVCAAEDLKRITSQSPEWSYTDWASRGRTTRKIPPPPFFPRGLEKNHENNPLQACFKNCRVSLSFRSRGFCRNAILYIL